MRISASLRRSCSAAPSRRDWLARLPERVDEIELRWHLSVDRDRSFDSTAGWIAPAQRTDGSSAVLKLIMPHFEAEHEIHGLLFWRGHPTVLVFEADPTSGAVLMEACRPGVPLSTRTEEQQDEIIATLLRQAWNAPPAEPFRSLASMLAHRAEEVTREAAAWPDPAAVTRGLDIMAEMAASSRETVVLITDLHAGNVLRSVRAPWLVVDPKPFVGDRAYDATQHLLNCRHRLRSDPRGTIGRFSRLLEVDATRVQRWLYARLTADPRDTWEADAFELAARLSV